MSQFRQNFITKEWVIIAPERAKRPDQFAKKFSGDQTPKPEHDPKCPFCPGNEAMTPQEVYRDGGPGDWRVRVVPNKFAAVSPDSSPARRTVGRFLEADGFGRAEVIIESPLHNHSIAMMTTDGVKNVLGAYKARYEELSKDENVDMVTIFRNNGPQAGTSLVHPHSQVIATSMIQPVVRNLMQQALFYHDTYGQCPYCVMLEEELKQKDRIVIEGKHFVVFCFFASRTPFETRIIPKRHNSHFLGITKEEMDELAEILRITLKKFHEGLNDPDYNLIVSSSPVSDGELHYDHWRITIIPRLTTPAGFELGSGIFINIMPPEESAKFLRGVKAD